MISLARFRGSWPVSTLTLLDLRGNGLAYPSSSGARTEYAFATRICRGGASATCLGVPPEGCSAFANARPSVADPNECVLCDNLTAGLVFGICVVVAGVAALAVFIRIIIRHPKALKRWVSTATILINHAQRPASSPACACSGLAQSSRSPRQASSTCPAPAATSLQISMWMRSRRTPS